MEFQPFRAGWVFAGCVVLPVLLVVVATRVHVPYVWPILVGSVPVLALLFSLGATLAPHPHRLSSLVTCVLVTWTFSWSINGVAEAYFGELGPLQNIALAAIQLVFVFLAGWRLAPRQASVHA